MPYGDVDWYRERVQHLENELSGQRLARFKAEKAARDAERAAEKARKDYDDLAATVAEITDHRRAVTQFGVSTALKAMQHSVERIKVERIKALNEAENERAIRRRVHARYKRMRRETAVAAYDLASTRTERDRLARALESERRYGEEARRMAMTAYKILQVEDLEDAGAEPTWP